MLMVVWFGRPVLTLVYNNFMRWAPAGWIRWLNSKALCRNVCYICDFKILTPFYLLRMRWCRICGLFLALLVLGHGDGVQDGLVHGVGDWVSLLCGSQGVSLLIHLRLVQVMVNLHCV